MVDCEHSRTVPAISMTTAEILELDILAKSPNPQLVPYTDTRLHDQNCNCNTLQAFDTFMPTKGNFCPGCHQFSLRLNLWDFMTNVKGAPAGICKIPLPCSH